jgi:hypothetical protein
MRAAIFFLAFSIFFPLRAIPKFPRPQQWLSR